MEEQKDMSDYTDLKQGERRTASVLFSDMKGFTSLSESMDPEEIDNLMNSLFSLFEQIIKKYDGVVEKYIGDALVAAFGINRVHEDDSSRAVHAALEFQYEITKRTGAVQFRTGIDSGLITTGKRGDYDVVTGHVMSVASRLQEIARDGTVYVSNAVHELCGNEFLYGDAEILYLKGIEEPTRAYRVLGINHAPFEYEGPFFGRSGLLNKMVKTYLKQGENKIYGFSLTGDPGIGKTRTIAEFIKTIVNFPDFKAPLLYTRARQFRNLPFSAVCELILSHLRIDFVNDAKYVAKTLSEAVDIEYAKATIFAELVVHRSFDSEGEVFVVLNLILDSIMLRSEDEFYSPVMYIDNIHTVDRLSKDFFRFYLANGKILPFFILAGRWEDREYRTIFKDLLREKLDPLEEAEARKMLEMLLPDDINPGTVNKVLHAASGNPLYLEEYAGFVSDGSSSGGLPPNIQTIMLAPLENYDPEIKQLLKRISVFHRAFTVEDAEYLQGRAGGNPGHVSIALSFYVRQGHLARQGSAYYFRHDLFRRTLYNSLLNYNKRILHGYVADRLMNQTPFDRLNLLHHLSKAERIGDLEKEFFKDARHVHDYDFLVYINLLISKTPKDDSRYFHFLYTKYRILINTGRTAGSDIILRELVNLCVEKKENEYLARIYHILSANHLASNSFSKAMICATRAIRYYRRTDEHHRSIANAQVRYANAALYSNRLDLNLRIIESMTPPAGQKLYDDQSEAWVERLVQIGEYKAAEQLLKKRLTIADPATDELYFRGYHKLCSLYFKMYDAENLGKLCRQMLRSKAMSIQETSETYAMLAFSVLHTGGEEQVENYMRLAEYFRNQMQNDMSIVETTRLIAVAYRILGENTKALELAEAGVRIGMRHTAYYHQFGLVVLLAEIYTELEDSENARFFLNEADVILELKPLLDSQEETIYWFLKYIYEKQRTYLRRARALLRRERKRIGKKNLINALMSSRLYGRIQKEWDTIRRNYGHN